MDSRNKLENKVARRQSEKELRKKTVGIMKIRRQKIKLRWEFSILETKQTRDVAHCRIGRRCDHRSRNINNVQRDLLWSG